MTCAFCNYDFCWACGGSASREDNHFGFMRGCGVKMMDESVKPGDKGAKRNCCWEVTKVVLKVLLMIVLYPFWLVLFLPISMAIAGWKLGNSEGNIVIAVYFSIWLFVTGIFFDICWIPFALMLTLCVVGVCCCQCCMFCAGGCGRENREQQEAAEAANRAAAERQIRERKQKDKAEADDPENPPKLDVSATALLGNTGNGNFNNTGVLN